MDKLEYLKKVITETNLYNDKSWYVSAFALLIKEYIDDSWKTNAIKYSIIKTIDKLNYVDIDEAGNLILVPISGYKKNEPLFTFQEEIEVDNTWLPSIDKKITTKIGNLIVNTLVIYASFKNKVPYINTVIKVSDLEAIIASKLKNDNEAKEGDILVSDMTEFVDRLYFLTNLADIINISATYKTITSPPGLKAEKTKLLKEYNGNLHDPVKLVEFENKLQAIDDEYMKDDPTNKITNKKSKIARKKMFLVFGSERGFEETSEVNPIVKSLEEGVDTDDKVFPEYMNGLRSGAYSRGAETVKGGVTYKVLQRSLSNLNIVDVDCKTTKGLVRFIDKLNYVKLVNRNIKVGGKWVTITNIEEAKKYIDKSIEIRSAMFCKSEENTLCCYCLSTLYANQPGGIASLAAEVSGSVLGLFLKQMHSVQASTVRIEMEDLVT